MCAWLIHTCDMQHVWCDWCIRATCDMCAETHAYVWHDSYTYVTLLIHTCDMTQLYVRHDSSAAFRWKFSSSKPQISERSRRVFYGIIHIILFCHVIDITGVWNKPLCALTYIYVSYIMPLCALTYIYVSYIMPLCALTYIYISYIMSLCALMYIYISCIYNEFEISVHRSAEQKREGKRERQRTHEREGETQREGGRDRYRERDRERDRESERKREGERVREREWGRERERERGKTRERKMSTWCTKKSYAIKYKECNTDLNSGP